MKQITCGDLEELMNDTRSFTGGNSEDYYDFSGKLFGKDFSFLEKGAKVLDTKSKASYVADNYKIDPVSKFPQVANLPSLDCRQLKGLQEQLKSEILTAQAGNKQKKVIDSAISDYTRKLGGYVASIDSLLVVKGCDLQQQQEVAELDAQNKLSLYKQIMGSGFTDGDGGLSSSSIGLIVAGILTTTLVIVLMGGKKQQVPVAVPMPQPMPQPIPVTA